MVLYQKVTWYRESCMRYFDKLCMHDEGKNQLKRLTGMYAYTQQKLFFWSVIYYE
jgi:hypothetical protein